VDVVDASVFSRVNLAWVGCDLGLEKALKMSDFSFFRGGGFWEDCFEDVEGLEVMFAWVG